MIKDNIVKVKERISAVCSKINRDPAEITIVAVSKARTPEQIREAIEAGITDIGENKVQEAFSKYNAIRDTQYAIRAKWHMVGHLQSNKAKDAVRIFALIQSINSIHVALEVNKQAAKINKIQAVLIQINTSGEVSKFGLKPADTIEVIKEVIKLKNINIRGLMTIAPIVDNPEKARPYFRILRELRDSINKLQTPNSKLQTLSMGMTDDFEVAIEEGSNMIRLGRAIFEG